MKDRRYRWMHLLTPDAQPHSGHCRDCGECLSVVAIDLLMLSYWGCPRHGGVAAQWDVCSLCLLPWRFDNR